MTPLLTEKYHKMNKIYQTNGNILVTTGNLFYLVSCLTLRYDETMNDLYILFDVGYWHHCNYFVSTTTEKRNCRVFLKSSSYDSFLHSSFSADGKRCWWSGLAGACMLGFLIKRAGEIRHTYSLADAHSRKELLTTAWSSLFPIVAWAQQHRSHWPALGSNLVVLLDVGCSHEHSRRQEPVEMPLDAEGWLLLRGWWVAMQHCTTLTECSHRPGDGSVSPGLPADVGSASVLRERLTERLYIPDIHTILHVPLIQSVWDYWLLERLHYCNCCHSVQTAYLYSFKWSS